jgi:hypothetical protein
MVKVFQPLDLECRGDVITQKIGAALEFGKDFLSALILAPSFLFTPERIP